MARIAFGRFDDSFSLGSFRSYIAEFISTLLFVFAGVGSAIAYNKLTSNAALDPEGLVAIAICHGFALFVAVSVGANISGGHVNPAVTFGLALGGQITVLTGIFYWIAQLLGSIVACFLLKAVTGGLAIPIHSLAAGVGAIEGVVMEIIITFALVYTVYATAADPKKGSLGIIAPIAIGFIVGANILGYFFVWFLMEGHHPHPHPHHLQHQQQQQQHHHISVNVDTSDRFPQWSVQETKEFLMIRAELDRTFMETKRNKLLWEVISTKMKEKGFNRSAEQCKCKWKNLVTRYKGCETMEPEAMRQQFPFYNELQAIFTARMQRMLWAEAEGAASGSKKKAAQLSSDEEEDIEDSEGEIKGNTRKKIKKSSKSNITGSSTSGVGSGSGNNFNHLKEILDDFMKQQLQIEVQWREAFEARENERRLKEMEWRQHMEALESERILMEQRWREREEQRRMREEARAEKRDALITALLSKIRREDM